MTRFRRSLLGLVKMVWNAYLILFLIMSGWLLHILEGVSRSVIKGKKSFNKKATGAGTVAALVASPVLYWTSEGRRAIKQYLTRRYSAYLAIIV